MSTAASAGVAFRSLLANAPVSYARSLLGPEVCELLDLLDGGRADDDRIREVAAAGVDLEGLVADQESRSELLRQLDEDQLAALVGRLPGPDESDRGLSSLAGADWTRDQRRVLLGFLGAVVERVPDEGPPARRDCCPAYGLFSHQRRTARHVQAELYQGERRALLHLPTGAGKTRIAQQVIAEHLRAREPTVVVWLTHGRELLEQAAAEFERAWTALGDREVMVHRAWGSGPVELDAATDGLVVFGVEKASEVRKRSRATLDRLASRATLVVFDEAHQIVAPTYRRVVDALTTRRDASLLGLTATPGRTWADISSDEQLAEFFAHRKVLLEIEGAPNPVTALIEQGYLARPSFRTLKTESGLELSDPDHAALAQSIELSVDLVGRLSDDHQWNLQLVRTVTELVATHTRVMVFAGSVKHCRLLSAVLNAEGVESAYVTGSSSVRQREQAIARFKRPSPTPMVLCNYGVLTTGFDAPGASAAVIARPTRSLVLYSQMVGRVIRGPAAGGTATCEIVTMVDTTLPGFGDVADAFLNWEDVWQS